MDGPKYLEHPGEHREVLRETVPLNGTTLSHILPLTPFAPGLYHLHLADGKRWLAGGNVVVSPP